MYLSKIYIKNFRGIKELLVEFDKNLNVIIGANGQLKTSLMDAIRLFYSWGEPNRDIEITKEDFFVEITQNVNGTKMVTPSTRIDICYLFEGLSLEQEGAFRGCSKLEKATFQGKLPQNTINCGLQSTCIFYVPKAYYQNYKDALGSKYSYIYPSKDEESGEQKPDQCAVPTISYADGKLTFACSTPNAEYHYTITDTDMASDTYSKDGIVKLSAAYNISVYATADGYKASDKATATLYWIEANLQNYTTNINQTATRGIIATSNDGIVTLSGLNNSEIVRFYTVDGKQIGTAKAINGTASQAVSESIVIAKIGNQTIKIAVK